MKILMRLLREPLFHFSVIGGLFFLLYAVVDDVSEEPADVITITPQRIDQLVAGFSSVWNRDPTPDEVAAMIEEDIREEVYYREALALGLDRNDTIVRRRLRQKMEFLLDNSAGLLEPTRDELETYYNANQETFVREPRLALEHIYLGNTADPQMIARSLETLRSDPTADPSSLGERSLLPARLGLSPRNAIDGVFGEGFFGQILDIAPGAWAGPVTSSFGVHLVRIVERLPARMPPLDEIREAVLRDWRAAKAREIRDLDYARRRENFAIEVRRRDPPATENQ